MKYFTKEKCQILTAHGFCKSAYNKKNQLWNLKEFQEWQINSKSDFLINKINDFVCN